MNYVVLLFPVPCKTPVHYEAYKQFVLWRGIVPNCTPAFENGPHFAPHQEMDVPHLISRLYPICTPGKAKCTPPKSEMHPIYGILLNLHIIPKKEEARCASSFLVRRKDGLERAAPVRALVQKLRAGEQFLARGRVHGYRSAVRKYCETISIIYERRCNRFPSGVSTQCSYPLSTAQPSVAIRRKCHLTAG